MLTCLLSLSLSLIIEFLKMVFHVHSLLRLVQGLKTGLEERALHLVVRLFSWPNFQSWLVITDFTSLPQDGDVSWRVNFLKDHLKLIKETKCVTSFHLHDLVNLPGVKLDVKVP